jgi:hypothetical protein
MEEETIVALPLLRTDGRWEHGTLPVGSVMVWACAGSNGAGSDFPLKVPGRISGLRAFRNNPLRAMRDYVSRHAYSC